ncbi:MAG: hypothetical protein C0603_05065 [Denitrovibrio sp.]|nr:MAG: hypothetical protein C0603_05065 [Denitrovibrio sp.]
MGKFLELVTTDEGWEYVKRVNSNGAAIVLVYHTDREEYLMVEQYRPPIGCRVLEMPAGLIDQGESPSETAVREVYEETGVRITQDDLIDLGVVYSGVGMTNEEVNIFAVEINTDTLIEEPAIEGTEIAHGLVTKWLKEEELYLLKAAKALSVFMRYKIKKQNPDMVFPD